MEKKKVKLCKDLAGLTEQLDVESLEFLKSQASTLLYNQEVRKKNASDAATRDTQKSPSSKKKKTPRPSQPKVCIEQLKKPGYFNLCIQNSKLFMDLHEIKAIYKIAQTAGSSKEGAQRLYGWFKKERSDVLVDGGIGNKTSPTLTLIYKELLDTFSTK